MEINIKFNEKMLVETANRVLDEFEYNGKTIREWADLLANPQTNADRIRAMTDEELAELLISVCNRKECPPNYVGPCRLDCDSGDCWAKWLKQEASE